MALEIVLLANPKSQTPVLTAESALGLRPRRALSSAQVERYDNVSKQNIQIENSGLDMKAQNPWALGAKPP